MSESNAAAETGQSPPVEELSISNVTALGSGAPPVENGLRLGFTIPVTAPLLLI
jgi:hypothetical protein